MIASPFGRMSCRMLFHKRDRNFGAVSTYGRSSHTLNGENGTVGYLLSINWGACVCVIPSTHSEDNIGKANCGHICSYLQSQSPPSIVNAVAAVLFCFGCA